MRLVPDYTIDHWAPGRNIRRGDRIAAGETWPELHDPGTVLTVRSLIVNLPHWVNITWSETTTVTIVSPERAIAVVSAS